ncbi:hypothetical protein [Piscinibacterium candidicorallinum]|uniref:Transmembrane protein n=1 Tax=Piscinibacterium candidicorallinum TaxID=1793872 RepID=A0ABV7H726_9BURK
MNHIELLLPLLVPLSVAYATVWVFAVSAKPDAIPRAGSIGWLIAGVVFVAGCAWMLWADQMPWVVPSARRYPTLNELLTGGFREYPVVFVLLWLLCAAMAAHCFKRFWLHSKKHPE